LKDDRRFPVHFEQQRIACKRSVISTVYSFPSGIRHTPS
jgi:hypothetical protein